MERAPEYPRSPELLRGRTRARAVAEAVRATSGGRPTKLAASLLEALELGADPSRSRYARRLLERVRAAGEGRVLNRREALDEASGTFEPGLFSLEADLLAVVIAALVRSGELVVRTKKRRIDGASLARDEAPTPDELASWKHLEAPRENKGEALRAVFELLGLVPELAEDALAERAVAGLQLRRTASDLAARVARARSFVRSRPAPAGRPLAAASEWARLDAALGAVLDALDALRPYGLTARFASFRFERGSIGRLREDLRALDSVEELRERLASLCSEGTK